MSNRLNRLQRLSLAILLVLVVFGFAGHLLAPAGGIHHPAPESACVFHAGCLAPVFQVSGAIKLPDLPISSQATARALCVTAKIPHPPTV
jgi:hypothetical protein